MFVPALGIPLDYSHTAAGRRTAAIFLAANRDLASGDLAKMVIAEARIIDQFEELQKQQSKILEELAVLSPDIAQVDDEDPEQERLGAQLANVRMLSEGCVAALTLFDDVLPSERRNGALN